MPAWSLLYLQAVYRLAKAHAAQGDIPAALEQLTTIFSKNVRGRRTFAINMRCIDSLDSLGFQGKNQRKRKQQREELGDAPEAHWGHAPRTIKEPGIEEPSAKMMGAMRKYLVLYIELLATSGAVPTPSAFPLHITPTCVVIPSPPLPPSPPPPSPRHRASPAPSNLTPALLCYWCVRNKCGYGPARGCVATCQRRHLQGRKRLLHHPQSLFYHPQGPTPWPSTPTA